MFNIFKRTRKFNLEWLKVDMHSHLLPGIDDGCADTEQSIRCIEGLRDLGFDTLYMTPHIFPGVHPNNTHTIETAFQELIAALPDKIKENIHFGTAAEHMISVDFEGNQSFAKNCLLPGDRILIEMSYLAPSPNIDQVVFDLQIEGYLPILAHPERYSYYYRTPERYIELRNRGCALQCNLLSFTGYYGKKVKRIAEGLASRGLIDFLGTDLHNEGHLNAIKTFYTRIDARGIFTNCVLKNQDLS